MYLYLDCEWNDLMVGDNHGETTDRPSTRDSSVNEFQQTGSKTKMTVSKICASSRAARLFANWRSQFANEARALGRQPGAVPELDSSEARWPPVPEQSEGAWVQAAQL